MKEVRSNASEWENTRQRLSDTRQNLKHPGQADFSLIWQYVDEKFENLENNLAISLGIIFSMNENNFREKLKEEREEMKSVAKQRVVFRWG